MSPQIIQENLEPASAGVKELKTERRGETGGKDIGRGGVGGGKRGQ